ncbi:EamA-like transporter family protein [Desulfotomaculum arcticum]|uniref:EamA-like transporter family protein n=1 Tax=Desulfotruncus arcticus DSM 17038 TaxID=1121424 RepID=A0A1I2SN15_9FIRM|nr:EamA family transporter [Desulfotruncus arcticus]SFG54134.1 EamA-like transporter family protein [Desulfotomaculum arcticum] [Desulfotruncus arcticus DSM 17038]
MFMYVFSIVLIVGSNIVYNVCQKSTPEKANPFSALIITYLTATVLTVVALLFYKTDKGFFKSFEDLNWTSVVLGVSIIGLELGYLLAYRAGWKISLGSLVANISLAVVLIPIGILFYNEEFGMNKVLGAVFCIIGLILINK